MGQLSGGGSPCRHLIRQKRDDFWEDRNQGDGGLGDPKTRLPESVAEDVCNGMVSMEAARDDYGVILKDGGAIDETATRKIRSR